MEPMAAQGTWTYECFREYAEHSLEHDNMTDTEIERNVAEFDAEIRPAALTTDVPHPGCLRGAGLCVPPCTRWSVPAQAAPSWPHPHTSR